MAHVDGSALVKDVNKFSKYSHLRERSFTAKSYQKSQQCPRVHLDPLNALRKVSLCKISIEDMNWPCDVKSLENRRLLFKELKLNKFEVGNIA